MTIFGGNIRAIFADVFEWLTLELRNEHREIELGDAFLAFVILPVDFAFLDVGHTRLHLVADAVVVENRLDELIALLHDAVAFDLHTVDAEIAQGRFVGKPEDIGFVAQVPS